MLKNKGRRYKRFKKSNWPKSHRYRYNTPVEFKIAKVCMILLIVIIALLSFRSENIEKKHTNIQNKITTFEVPLEVTEQIFTRAKNNNKDAATYFANYIMGKKPGVFSPRINKQYYKEAINCYKQFIFDLERFPLDMGYQYVYEDSWCSERTYGGKRKHYGTDIMDKNNKRGSIPIYSMSSGIVENIGWNDMGGYRIGIRSKNGAYIYYAHLYGYAPNIEKGMKIEAGDLIGYMGDSGYGKEGTVGKFQVHLHIGIATRALGNDEQWINPYYILKYLEEKDLELNKSRGIF